MSQHTNTNTNTATTTTTSTSTASTPTITPPTSVSSSDQKHTQNIPIRMIEPYFNHQTVNTLIQMGFTRNKAIHGLYATGGVSADDAMMWLLVNESNPDLNTPLLVPAPYDEFPLSTTADSPTHSPLDPYQLAQLLSTDTSGSGRQVTQQEQHSIASLISSFASGSDSGSGSGPTVTAERHKMVLCVRQDLNMSTGKIASQCAHAAVAAYIDLTSGRTTSEALQHWLQDGQPKIVVSIPDEKHMHDLVSRARSLCVPVHVIHDAGRTEVASGTATVLAVGPGPITQIDKVTKHLPLFK